MCRASAGYELLFSGFSGSLTSDATEHDDIGISIAAEAVRAMRHTRDFTGSPETRNRLALSRQSLCLFVDTHAAHRVVNARNGLDDVVLALRHVNQAGAVVEVLVVALAGHGADAIDRALEAVERNLGEVSYALQIITGSHDALLGECFVFRRMFFDGVGNRTDLVVPEHPAVAAGLLQDGFGQHVTALQFFHKALAFLISSRQHGQHRCKDRWNRSLPGHYNFPGHSPS